MWQTFLDSHLVQDVVATLVGLATAFGAYVVLATVRVDHGIPGIVTTRGFLGIGASTWVISIIRALSAAFWFAVQSTAGAIGIIAASDRARFLGRTVNHPHCHHRTENQ